MDILVPIDGSEPSERALRFGAEMADRFESSLKVVHITDEETDATEQLLDRAETILREAGFVEKPTIAIDIDLGFRSADKVGNEILDLVETEGFDHVVMGHHGTGVVDRAILGSAAETVIDANDVPVTVVP